MLNKLFQIKSKPTELRPALELCVSSLEYHIILQCNNMPNAHDPYKCQRVLGYMQDCMSEVNLLM